MDYQRIEAVYPAPSHLSPLFVEGALGATRLESLQPLLRWKPLSNHEGTYDVIIYETEKTASNPIPGKEAYYRENLSGTTHKVEEPLKRNMWYLWTVRTRNGALTDKWATYTYQMKKLLLERRYGARYFLFETPD